MSGAIAMGAHKVTGLANGSAADDAAAFGQITGAPDATTSAKGIVELANDLGGTAASPTVVGLHLAGDTSIGHKLTSVSAPTAGTDAANKDYVDAAIFGLTPCSADLATNGPLPTCTGSGTGVLTITATGTLSVDGIVSTLGQRILVHGQAATKDNGVYKVTTAGGIGVSAVLTRAVDVEGDAATWANVVGQFVAVQGGSTLADTVWLSTATPGGTLNTNGFGYVQIQGFDLAGAAAAAQAAAIAASDTAGAAAAAAAASLPLAGGTMSGAIAMGTKKITGLGDGSGAQDAAAFHQIPTTPGAVGAMASGATLHGIAAANANDGDIAVNTHKITGLTNGSAASDAAAFGQIPVVATVVPVMDGTATIGAAGKYADGAHIHPTDTSLAPKASPTFTGTVTLPSGIVIPSGALGYKLLSDASGNAAWASDNNDAVQAGLVGITNTGVITAAEVSGTLTFTNWPTGDFVWFQRAAGVIFRAVMPASTGGSWTLPGSGKFRYIAADVSMPTTPGGTATLVARTAAADQNTALLAAANPIGPQSGGDIRIWDGILWNNGGTATLVSAVSNDANCIPAATGRDRRPWARGANARLLLAANPTLAVATTWTAVPLMSQRIECSGAPLTLKFHGFSWNNNLAGGQAYLGWFMDGAYLLNDQLTTVGAAGAWNPGSIETQYIPNPGSHLFCPAWYMASGTLLSMLNYLGEFVAKEEITQLANNGTA